MAATPVRFNIGLKRLHSKSQTVAVIRNTRQARAQMQILQRRLMSVAQIIREATPEAVELALNPIYEKSQIYVPVGETGDLKASGFVDVQQRAGGVQGEVGYAPGGDPHYAVFVHENLENWHEPPTRAKFLQVAIEEHIDDIPKIIQEHLRLE